MSANYRHTMLEDLTEWAVPKPDDSHNTPRPNRTPFEVSVAEGDAVFFSVLAEIQTTLRCKFFTDGVYGDDTDVVYIGYDGCTIDAAHVRWQYGEGSPRLLTSAPSVCNHKYADYNPKHEEIATTIPRSFITNVKRHARIILDGEEAEKIWHMNMALEGRRTTQRPREWFHIDADRHRADLNDARFSLSSYGHSTENFTTMQLESALNTELLHIHRSGYTFITEEITEFMGRLDRAQRALDELDKVVSRVLYVKYITPDTFKVCISLEPDTRYLYPRHSDTFCAYSVPLTDSEMSRVGALSICDRYQPVEDIGIRVGATSFLVYAG
jgi:hypothetical protein